MMRALRLSISVVVLLSLGCGYLFEREVGLDPGEVNGRVDRLDVDEPAAFTRIGLPGSQRVARALNDGAFRVAGLPPGDVVLRFEDDGDGDGWAERGGYAAARLPFDSETGQVGFVLMGTLGINGVMGVT